MNFGKRLIGITLLFSMGFLTGLTVYSVLDRDSMNTNQGSLRGGRPNPLSGKFYDGLESVSYTHLPLPTILLV